MRDSSPALLFSLRLYASAQAICVGCAAVRDDSASFAALVALDPALCAASPLSPQPLQGIISGRARDAMRSAVQRSHQGGPEQLLPCCHHLSALVQSRTLRGCRHQPACHLTCFPTAWTQYAKAQCGLLTTLRQRNKFSCSGSQASCHACGSHLWGCGHHTAIEAVLARPQAKQFCVLRHQEKLVCCSCYAQITIRLLSTCRGIQRIHDWMHHHRPDYMSSSQITASHQDGSE